MDEQIEIHENPELESYLRRNFNALTEQSIIVRKQAAAAIYDRIREEKVLISGSISQQILLKFSKDLLKAMCDTSEKVRELAILTLKEQHPFVQTSRILSRCDDMQPVLPYVFAVLTERSNCHDLEGILHLPEVMRPPPDQKPKMLIRLVEPSEELRVRLVDLLSVVISCNEGDALHDYIEDIVNILRAFCMDPFGEVQRGACQCLSEFCRNNHQMLLHFTEPMARALLFPLISKKSKIRIAALEAMGSVLECGIWKHNAFVFEILTGFKDPNSMPIKAFYEPMHNINYLATLIIDPNERVREMFIGSVGDWLTRLADRWDHHARLVPYILSGLFDSSSDIQESALETIEQVGIEWEKEREKDIKEQQQLGVESEWTLNGQLVNLPLVEPFTRRPRLGARGFIRSQVRKMWPALYKELKDHVEENRLRAANLMLLGVLYSEDYMTQFLDQFIPNTITAIECREGDSKLIMESTLKVKRTYQLLGRFCDFSAYMPIVFSGVRGKYQRDEWYMKCAMSALNSLLEGALEATIEGVGVKCVFVGEIIDLLSEPNQLEFITTMNYPQAEHLLVTLIEEFQKRATSDELQQLLLQKGAKLVQILDVLQYISQFGSTLLINLPLTKEVISQTLQQLDSSRPSTLKAHLPHLEQQPMQISFQDLTWKCAISDLTYRLLNGEPYLAQLNLIIDTLHANTIPDIPDFLIKYGCVLLHRSHQIEVFSAATTVIAESLHWLAKIKQPYAKKFHDMLFENIMQTLQFMGSKQTFAQQWKAVNKDTNFLKYYSQLLIAVKVLSRQLFKNKLNEWVVVVSELMNRCLPYPNAKHLVADKVYLLPTLTEYLFDQIDVLGDTPKPDTKFRLLTGLSLILQYIPNSSETQYYSGDEHICPKYQHLLDKLIRYTIEEKDLESSEKYLAILKLLRQKTPYNFYIEFENAKQSSSLSRVELLRNYIN